MNTSPSFSGDNDAKEQVRQATDIVDLVGGYMQLRRQGRGYVGLCPWHDDSRPSLQVNPERQTFKCWVCDLGGDIFSFVMKMENLEFREALEMLAERAGVSLAPTGGGPRAEPGSPGDKKTLLAALAWAEERYHRCLLESPQADPARRYLDARGVSRESVDRFRIGFAPSGWDWLLRQAPGGGFSPAVLERVNLIAPRKSGEGWYDQFRGRVIFPIHDVRSRPVAFGGRVLPELAEAEARPGYTPAKYVNSSETPVYSKSRELYALDMARDEVQQRGSALVVEGYTDVIALHQAGVRHAVAACGTAMGEGHLKLLRRFTERLVLVLDGDEAGRRRASELLELFIASPVDLRILTLPDGLDPCDFISSHGSDEFERLLAAAPDALEHKLQSVTNGMALSVENTHDASRAVEQVLATLARTRPSLGEATSAVVLREQGVVGRLARHFRLPEEGLRRRLADLRRASAARDERAPETAYDDRPQASVGELPAWDREALELMLCDAASASRLAAELGEVDFSTPLSRELFGLLRSIAETGQTGFDACLAAAGDERQKRLIIDLDERGSARTSSDPALRLHDLLLSRTRRHEGAEAHRKMSALRKGELPDSEADEAVAALFATRKRRETRSPSTEG